MSRTIIPVEALRVGMYVAKLDVGWLRSPFLRHSFLIKRTSQIERLVKNGVKTVEIDPDRGITNSGEGRSGNLNLADVQEPRRDGASFAPSQQVKPLAQLNEEYAQAKLVRQQLDQAVQSLFSNMTKTGTINAEQAAEAVQEITIAARTLPRAALFMALSQNRAGDVLLGRHALAACTLALVLGQSFQFNPLELQELATAALLHDIGLLQIPTTLVQHIHVTSSLPSEQERRQFRAHPRLSRKTLEEQGRFDPSVLAMVANHHPAYSSADTPLPASAKSLVDRTAILALVDKYDELLTGFGGASPFSPQQAIQRLYLDAPHSGLDQNILAQFISAVGIYPVQSYVTLNTKELAVVTSINREKLHQPVVTITHKPGGEQYPTPLVVDLAHQEGQGEQRSIKSVLDGLPESFSSSLLRAV